MAKEPLTMTIDPASELPPALAGAEVPVVLDSDGVRYTVNPEDLFARYDARAVLDGLRQSRGALRGVDTAALLADLSERRSQDPIRLAWTGDWPYSAIRLG